MKLFHAPGLLIEESNTHSPTPGARAFAPRYGWRQEVTRRWGISHSTGERAAKALAQWTKSAPEACHC